MTFRIVSKDEIMNMLGNERLYLLRVSSRGNSKYCSSKQVSSLKIREVMDGVKDDNVAFLEITN